MSARPARRSIPGMLTETAPLPAAGVLPHAAPAISVRGLRVTYGDVEAVRGIDLEVPRGEILALLGPNGAGKTLHRRGARGLPRRHRRRRRGARARPAHGRPRLARPPRHRAPGDRAGVQPHRARVPAPLRRLLLRPARPRRGARPRRARRERGAAHRPPVGRPAAAPRRRARARRRPGADLPRRADDRVRPGRAAAHVGGRRRPARARQDDPPDHALHGGGRAARRPDRRHGPRRGRRRGHARDARRP